MLREMVRRLAGSVAVAAFVLAVLTVPVATVQAADATADPDPGGTAADPPITSQNCAGKANGTTSGPPTTDSHCSASGECKTATETWNCVAYVKTVQVGDPPRDKTTCAAGCGKPKVVAQVE